jgi:hypothetical protein
MKSDKFIIAEMKRLFAACDFCVNTERLEFDIKTESSCMYLVGPLHNVGVEPVHGERGFKAGFEEMRAADMVHMTVSEDEVFNLRGVKACSFDVLDDTVMGEP